MKTVSDWEITPDGTVDLAFSEATNEITRGVACLRTGRKAERSCGWGNVRATVETASSRILLAVQVNRFGRVVVNRAICVGSCRVYHSVASECDWKP